MNKIQHIISKLFTRVKQLVSAKPIAVLAGVWSEQGHFLSAVKQLKAGQYKGFFVTTPFPVHGLEELLEIKRSWIPWVTFIFGLGGCLFGLWFTWWTSAVSWPLIIGGKPFWSLPAFVPVIFECTILLGALSSVGALLYACGLPAVDPPIIDPDLTSHKFAVIFDLSKEKKSSQELEKVLQQLGAENVIHSHF